MDLYREIAKAVAERRRYGHDLPRQTSADQPSKPSQNSAARYNRPDSPPPMDTYPTDSDEEAAAVERAIKASLSAASVSRKEPDDGAEESKVEQAVNTDVAMVDTDIQAATDALSDWRQNEDEDDVIPFREANA
jgi:hypothetical protein